MVGEQSRDHYFASSCCAVCLLLALASSLLRCFRVASLLPSFFLAFWWMVGEILHIDFYSAVYKKCVCGLENWLHKKLNNPCQVGSDAFSSSASSHFWYNSRFQEGDGLHVLFHVNNQEEERFKWNIMKYPTVWCLPILFIYYHKPSLSWYPPAGNIFW